VSLAILKLYKSFPGALGPIEVLRNVSLEMEKGQSLAITGPSGSGKSTLLHCIGTLTPPSSGSIRIEDCDPFELSEPELALFRNEVIGFVFQDHHLLPQYSVLENVLMPALAFPSSDQNGEQRARQLLERVGLGHRLEHRPEALSGGERQRVAVARGMMNRPSLLLCDEPTGNLDRNTAMDVAELLFELHREEGAILVVVTHSEELAGSFERRCELREGSLSERA
jgi:lipoprotein-releasing system ATP-binding protein